MTLLLSPLLEYTKRMAVLRTTDLHERAASAFAHGDFLELVRVAGEIVRVSPDDLTARIMVARGLGGLGREAEAARVHCSNCSVLLRNGFDLAAIEVCNEALRSCPGEFELYHSLAEVYDAIANRKPAIKARSLPPPLVVEIDSEQSGSLLMFTDEEMVVKTARDLALTQLRASTQSRPERGIPFFSGLSRGAFVSLVSEMERKNFEAGESLFEEGASGDSLYILLSGSVDVTRAGTRLATLSAGSLFGEMALITGQARTAGVRANKPASAFIIHVDDVDKLATDHPGIAESIVQFARRRMLMNVVSTSAFFRPLSESDRWDLLSKFSSRTVLEGNILLDEGDRPSGLFVVASGTLEVFRKGDDGERRVITELHEGEVLGEIALVRDIQITASVSAKSKSVVLYLKRDEFGQLIEAHPALRQYLESLSESRFQETDELMRLETEELCESELVML